MSDPHGPEPAPAPAWRRAAAALLLGRGHARAIPVAGALALLLLPLAAADPYWIRELSLIAVLALVIGGLNLSLGYAGALQFGQVFAFAVGCYVTMILARDVWDELVPLILVGGLAAGAVGAVIALAAARASGWSLAIGSLLLVVTVPDLVSLWPQRTGGLSGLIDIPAPQVLGHPLGPVGLYRITLVVALVWFALQRNLVTSRHGVMLRIVRESPELAGTLGLDPRRLRVLAYGLGAVPAGLAGCLFGFISLVVTPEQFGLTLAIGLVAGSLLGGSESVYGALLGAAFLQLGPEGSLRFEDYAPVAYGLLLIAAALAFRSGAAGAGTALARSGATRLLRSWTAPPRARPSAPLAPVTLEPLAGAALEVHALSVAFAGVRALDDVSLTARPGEVTAIIGANGSGKTTLLNVIGGFRAPERGGVVTLQATDITGRPPHTVARAGIARTLQAPGVPRGLSVVDVVASGRYARHPVGAWVSMLRLPAHRRAERADRRAARSVLAACGLLDLAEAPAARLSFGQRRMVELARAVCAEPRVLLLDEPAAGLSAHEAERLAAVVRAAARAGATVVLIEHDLAFVGTVADVVCELDAGALVVRGRAEPGVPGPVPSRPRRRRDVMLDARGVEAGHGRRSVVCDVTLQVPHGTVEALVGHNGAGKSTLLGALAGTLPLRAGEIVVGGTDVSGLPAHRRAAAGIAFVPEGRRIFRERTVEANVALGTLPLALSRADRARRCAEVLDLLPVLRERGKDRAGELSGGQQQLLAIGQAVAARPKLLLLDEPSAGLAPAVASEVFATLRRLSEDGLTVLLVEHRIPEVRAIADHVTVLEHGRVAEM